MIHIHNEILSSVQSLSHVQVFAIPWITARQASLSITNSWRLLKLTSIKLVMPSSHLNPCCPLLLLPWIPPSVRVYSNESVSCMRWPKYWCFIFSISLSNEHPGLISFRMDWLDLVSTKMEWAIKPWKDMEKPQMYITKWKKPIWKCYILYNSNYIAF